MDVVCVIDTVVGDHLEDRLCALEEVKQAVQSAGANFQRVQVRFALAVKQLLYNIYVNISYCSLRDWILGKRMLRKHLLMPMLP